MGNGDFNPKRPIGSTPGKGFQDVGLPYGLRIGIITRVDELSMKADVKVLTGGGDRFEVDLTQPMAGPRSFWGGVPELNSVVLIGYRQKHKQLTEAVILGYIPVGNKSGIRFDPFAPEDPGNIAPEDVALYKKVIGNTIRHKRLRLHPGDVGGMSAEGAELVLSRDVRMTNRAGDLFELRDAERTLVAQSIHRVESESGVRRMSGPIRRGALFLPPDIFKEDAANPGSPSRVLKNAQIDRYFGVEELQAAGPGMAGAPTKFADATGKVLDIINDTTESPPVTLTTGRRIHYASTLPAISVEDAEAGQPEAFTEYRIELAHTSDLTQDVLGEIDGFTMNPRRMYIEHVMGTMVGNDPHDGMGQRQYSKILRPKLFDDFGQDGPGTFAMEAISRSPLEPEVETLTTAGAYYFRINPPLSTSEDAFALAIQKQGKVLLNVPGSQVDRYPREKNVSAEVNMGGALKMFLGAASPDNISLYLSTAGGIKADLGHNTDTGNAIDVTYHCGVNQTFLGSQNEDKLAYQQDIQGNASVVCSGDFTESVQGSIHSNSNGAYNIRADQVNVSGTGGGTFTLGKFDMTVSGKTQYDYAQAVLETVVTGGYTKTVLAGAFVQTVAAGAVVFNALAGATTFNNPAGAFSITVGSGAISITTASGAIALSSGAGAIALSAAAGAITITAGLAITLTSGISIVLSAPQVLLGAPFAFLGVSRGIPMMPPGAPSLDWLTGLPLQGSALIRSM
jgi:hypothetical protein